MNLELLDPFGRQVPDRIDSTLELPAQLHFRSSSDGKQQQQQQQQQQQSEQQAPNKSSTSATTDHDEWKAAYHVAFNRRGTYVAIGYGSGTVAIHNVTSRSLAALYRNEDLEASPSNYGLGISNISWSRRSRTLLVGSAGDATVKLIDTTHPYGPDEANAAMLMVERDSAEEGGGAGGDANPSSRETQSREERIMHHSLDHTQNTSFTDADQRFEFMNRTLPLEPIHVVSMGGTVPGQPYHQGDIPYDKRGLRKYPAFSFTFPGKVGASLQLHPRITTAGLAVLEDGSLVLFWGHPNVWVEMPDEYPNHPRAVVVPIWTNKQTEITCAAFDPHGDRHLSNMAAGDRIFAATNDGRIMGFDIRSLLEILASRTHSERLLPSSLRPTFDISIPGAAAAWHLLVSRNGKFFVVNSADGALRLFTTKECWQKPNEVQKPTWVFQDVVTKVKFASCDLSGDGEYVVGGANGSENKYEVSNGMSVKLVVVLKPLILCQLSYFLHAFSCTFGTLPLGH